MPLTKPGAFPIWDELKTRFCVAERVPTRIETTRVESGKGGFYPVSKAILRCFGNRVAVFRSVSEVLLPLWF